MDDFMKLASMEYGISPLPENPVPAMAYVPYQQLEAVYGVEQGLMAGTIFPVLDKPILRLRREQEMNEREKLLKRIAAEDFAVIELHMFMDSHPNNKEAAMKLKEHDMKSQMLRKEFEETYGPLMANQIQANRWAWISEPMAMGCRL